MGRTVKREVTIKFVTTKTPEQINNAAKPLVALAESYQLQIERQDQHAKQDGTGEPAGLGGLAGI